MSRDVSMVKSPRSIMHFFHQLILNYSRENPDEIAYRFFQGSATHSDSLTYFELWQKTASLAFTLQARGFEGERVLICCRSEKLFILAFYACLMAGSIAVPTALPRRELLSNRLKLLASDAQIAAVLTDIDEISREEELDVAYINLAEWLEFENHNISASRWLPPAIRIGATAFLQYTSGSTGTPKGVVVTHANIVENCKAIRDALGLTAQSSLLNVLPLYHDLGLIGGILGPLYAGCSAGIISPNEVVQYPSRWLNIVSEYKITHSGGPHFLFDLAARTVQDDDIESCSLESWRVAYCGAEPIRWATIKSFSERFARNNFRPESFNACYGLAESTLFVSGNPVGMLPRTSNCHGLDIVGCGLPVLGTQVKIVDPYTCCEENAGGIGEIWVRSKSVANGYWNNKDLTSEVFGGEICGRPGHYFLRTGDLGFLEDGHLFVTGRLKDLIIIRGKKYTPQDIENVAEQCHPAVASGRCAAFSTLVNGTERLVFSFELDRHWMRRAAAFPEIARKIRIAINQGFSLNVFDVVLMRLGTLPRTSSGKLRRNQCRDDYASGEFDHIAKFGDIRP